MKITETNSLHKFKDILIGRKQNIFTFAIGSPENPMGEKSTDVENKKSRKEFESYLNKFRLYYFKISGQYGESEHSYLIANINEDICKYLFGSKMFNQESFIYGVIDPVSKDLFKTTFYYYSRNDKNKFEISDVCTTFNNEETAKDFFSKFKNFKFKIPFKTLESQLCSISDKLEEDFNWNTDYYSYLEYISKVNNKTIKHLWEYSCTHLLTKDEKNDKNNRITEGIVHLNSWKKKYDDNKVIKKMVDEFMEDNKSC